MTDMLNDVKEFQLKFGIPMYGQPTLLGHEDIRFRFQFLLEEMSEIQEAIEHANIEGIADGLVDLVYVALGTALIMGLPWDKLWDEVQRANMEKIRVPVDLEGSKRGHEWDVIKPVGWTPPDIWGILQEAWIELQEEIPND